MPHVDENLILFTIYAVAAGLAIPAIGLIPPHGIQHNIEWVCLPLTLAPVISVFAVRIDRIYRVYPYIVATGFVGIVLWTLVRITYWYFGSPVA